MVAQDGPLHGPRLFRGGETGGRQRRDRDGAAAGRELERDPAAERVAGEVGAREGEPVELRRDRRDQPVHRGRNARREVGRLVVPREREGDDVEPALQRGQDGLPVAPAGRDAVDQDERLSRARPVAEERHSVRVYHTLEGPAAVRGAAPCGNRTGLRIPHVARRRDHGNALASLPTSRGIGVARTADPLPEDPMPHTPRAPLHPAHATRIAVALLVAALAASGGVAAAIDQTILGSQLVVKDPGAVERRSVVGTARETASPNAIVGDPVAGGGQLEVAVDGASSTSQTFALPPGTSSAGRAFWSTMGTTGYQYRDPKGDNGPVSVVKIHRTASGTFLMSVRLKGKYGQLDVVPPNPGTGGCLALSLAGGDRYSAAFGADSVIANRGTLLFSAKKPLSEALCPVVPTPTPA